MIEPGAVLEAPTLGVRFEFRRTAAETGGEYLEMDVIGRPRGFIAQPHVHPGQVERHEVIAGAMAIRLHGRTRVLGAGESIETPAGTAHRHVAAGSGPGHVRLTATPAGRTEDFVERLVAMDRAGDFTRLGLPKPVPGARLVLEFVDDAHAASPPPSVQRAIANTILKAAEVGSNEYVFVDEWDVAAPLDAVYAAVGDASTYPEWWQPTYISVRTEGPAGVGQVNHHHFRGPLPYTLKATTRTTRYDPPTLVETAVDGDLRGTGIWTLTPRNGGTHVRFDWRVFADRPFLRVLTPVLQPVFRWNHGWAITQAQAGLEPHAQRAAAEAAAAHEHAVNAR